MFKGITKKIDVLDIAFIKIATAAFIIALIELYPSFNLWVQSVDPLIFVGIFIIFASRPIYRFWFKK